MLPLLVIAAVVVLLALWLGVLSTRAGRRMTFTILVATKYGLLWLSGLVGVRRLGAWLSHRPYEALRRPRILRLIFEDLGPTYIKLGQIIGSSPGLFTEAYVEEFRHCLDRVRPFPFEVAQAILDEELQDQAQALLLEHEPLASASIAQVHGVQVLDGPELVVKIQRPGIRELVDADLRIMRFWARVAHALFPPLRLANPIGIVEDFAKTIGEELDFVREGRNIEEFNRIMQELGHEQICAPRVDWPRTTTRVLTMERFYGRNVDDIVAIKTARVDPEVKLLEGMRAWFQCVMFYGLFHGDIHAGNLMWLDDGRIGFVDFGIVGRFNEQQRLLVTRFVMAFAAGQFRELAQMLVEMGSATDTVNIDRLAADLEQVSAPVRQLSFGQIHYTDLLVDVLRLALRHKLRLPREFILIIKQVLYFDRYARLLAPDLNVFTDPRVFAILAQDVAQAMARNAAAAGGLN